MSMRDSIKSLGGSGASNYVADDMVVDQLVARTRRTRAIRQASTTLVSAISAITLGVLAAQLFVSNVEDPAFRDRNLINDDASTSLQTFEERFGGIPSRQNEPVDLTAVKEALKLAAVQETTIQGLKAKSATQGVAAQRQTEAEKQAAAEEQARLDAKKEALKNTSENAGDCVAIDKGYKVFDCATGQWVYKVGPNQYWDDYGSKIRECGDNPYLPAKYYDCATKQWVKAATPTPPAGSYIDYQGKVRTCDYIHWSYPKHYDCAIGEYNHWGEGEIYSWNGSQWVCSGQNRGYAIYNCSTGYWDATGNGTEDDWFAIDDLLRKPWALKADHPEKWAKDEFGNWVCIG